MLEIWWKKVKAGRTDDGGLSVCLFVCVSVRVCEGGRVKVLKKEVRSVHQV